MRIYTYQRTADNDEGWYLDGDAYCFALAQARNVRFEKKEDAETIAFALNQQFLSGKAHVQEAVKNALGIAP